MLRLTFTVFLFPSNFGGDSFVDFLNEFVELLLNFRVSSQDITQSPHSPIQF